MIEYKQTHNFTPSQLQQLFQSVQWASAAYPNKLVKAMQAYETVISAWDNGQLIGLVSAMDDSVMTAYVHYVLVRPEYQGKGVGRKMMEMLKEHYANYLRIVLCAYNKQLEFYKHIGFRPEENETVMFITELKDTDLA